MELTSFLLQQIINAIFLGSIYALIALGYTMVYGIIELINFAHGDIMMIGTYAGYFQIQGNMVYTQDQTGQPGQFQFQLQGNVLTVNFPGLGTLQFQRIQ